MLPQDTGLLHHPARQGGLIRAWLKFNKATVLDVGGGFTIGFPPNEDEYECRIVRIRSEKEILAVIK